MRRGARLSALVLAAGAAAVLTGAPAASAATVVTWAVPSEHVEVASARLGFSARTSGGFKRTPRDALRVSVSLPDGYDGERRYPVLYLLHPYAWSHDYWSEPEGGNLPGVAPGLEAIVVMPEGGRGYTMDWWNGGRRGAPGWESFVLEDVVPYVESRLRTLPGRRHRAIGGFSMGAMGAVKLAARRPDLFGSVISLSGELDVHQPESQLAVSGLEAGYTIAAGDPDPVPPTSRDIFGDFEAQAFYWRGNDPLSLVENLRDTRVFATVGDGTPYDERDARSLAGEFAALSEAGVRESNRAFAAAARAAGLRDFTYVEHAGLHSDYMAGVELAQALAWGPFAPPPAERRDWSYRTVATRGRMWDLGYRFHEPPETLVRFRRDADVLEGDGAGTVTIEVPGGCTLTAELPFRRSLAAACAG